MGHETLLGLSLHARPDKGPQRPPDSTLVSDNAPQRRSRGLRDEGRRLPRGLEGVVRTLGLDVW